MTVPPYLFQLTRYCPSCYKLWKIEGKMPMYHYHLVSFQNAKVGDIVELTLA